MKALKSIYKRYCEDVIKRHKLSANRKKYAVDKYKSSKMKALRSFAKGLENDKTDNRRRTSNIRVIVKKIINMHHDGCCVLGFTVVSGE